MSIKGKRVGFLGAGNMGEAMIRGMVQAGLVPPDHILASDAQRDRLDSFRPKPAQHDAILARLD